MISKVFSKYMAIIVIAMALLALLAPSSVSFLKTSYVNTLLGIVMFGMGLTLKPNDFRVVFSRPKDVVIGTVAQFTIMPLLAFALSHLFGLSPELAVGVILVGTCPGGTSSNVMTYLSKGDVPLSVGMTAVSTILAPFMTPLLTYLYAGQTVDVDMLSMFLSIIQVVIVPIVLGFVINHYFSHAAERATDILPLVSTLAIVAIVGAVVSANADKLLGCGMLVLVVVMLHNVAGYALGYAAARLMKMSTTKCRAVSIEVGMQNSGLATSLATVHFAQYPLATIPGAVFSVWHNISGAVLANIFLHRSPRSGEGHLSTQLLTEAIALAEIGHQQKHTGKRHDKRHQIGDTGKRVVETMKQGRNGEGQHIERLAVARIEIGEAYEVAADATPQRMEKRKRRKPCDVEQEGGGVVGLYIDGRLILHPFENTERNARHQTIIDQRLGQKRFTRAAHQKEKRCHLDEFLGETHAKHVSDDIDREGHAGEEIEEIKLVEARENDEYRQLREKEHTGRGLDIDLSCAEKGIEEQSPDDGKIERHGIKNQQAADRKHHQHRQ